MVVKANVSDEAAAVGKEVRSVADVTQFSLHDGVINEKFKFLKPKASKWGSDFGSQRQLAFAKDFTCRGEE